MGAREFLHLLDDEGFVVMAEGDRLLVGPTIQLTEDWRRRIVEHKPELLTIAPRRQWRVCVPGREPFGIVCVQAISRDELLERYPRGTVVEPQS